ncbi:hypothetical protein TELCIR_03355 [Teladorsagia circumcincta]|uniref:E3 ubiquitin protein ligase n=1 Tax=Teladorsagia circumcincta TaxID=45464 RepID=A0A2G9UYQ2_TELCI|nr:hypothetical protein TELCIR_03355 [Teladorsagia circumcincta]
MAISERAKCEEKTSILTRIPLHGQCELGHVAELGEIGANGLLAHIICNSGHKKPPTGHRLPDHTGQGRSTRTRAGPDGARGEDRVAPKASRLAARVVMSKRSLSDNSDGSDQDDSHSVSDDQEIAAKKRRLVAFETVRLLSVSGVNDIDEKKAKVQAYKLSEAVRHKNKQLKTKEREIERLRQRQMTDENTSCTINRHWNNLDEQLRLIALRGASSEEVEELLESNDEATTGDFLDEIVQMEGVQGEHVYDKRVQQSVRLFEKVMQQLSRKSEHHRAFSKKLISFFESSSLAGESRDEAFHSIVVENERLTEENSRLQRETNRAQQKYARSSLKLKECEDQITLLTTRNEELARELEEAKFDLDKAQRLVNKLDYKLYTLAKSAYSSSAQIMQSTEYQNLVAFYSVVIDECRRLRSDYEAVTEERDLLRQEMLQKVEEMKADEHQSMRKMRSLCEQITRDLNQLRNDISNQKLRPGLDSLFYTDWKSAMNGNGLMHQPDTAVCLLQT